MNNQKGDITGWLDMVISELDYKAKEFKNKGDPNKRKKGSKTDNNKRSAAQVEDHLKVFQKIKKIAIKDPTYIQESTPYFKDLKEEMDKYLKNPGTLSISKALNDIYKNMELECFKEGDEHNSFAMSESDTTDTIRENIIRSETQGFEIQSCIKDTRPFMDMFKISYLTRPMEPDYIATCLRKDKMNPDSFSIFPKRPMLPEANICNYDLETLFFIFYFQEDPYERYSAAKELKSQDWRFHKKFLTWFKRHAKAPQATDEYEIGDFKTFDNEETWKVVTKPNFKFEYKFLEDEF